MAKKKSAGADLDIQDVIDQAKKAYESALKDLGKFNLALFGKTGVGKSTLINAVFGWDVAATGAGKPVTQETTFYEHPSEIFGLYDSKGVEVGEAGHETLKGFKKLLEEKRDLGPEHQVHTIWYCVRATDLRFEDGQAEFVRELARTGVPVMLVITQAGKRDGKLNPAVDELIKSIVERDLPLAPGNRVFPVMAQADEFHGLAVHGLQDLLDATFRVAPAAARDALNAAQQLDYSRKAKAARAYISGASASAAAVAATPIPFSDAVLLVPIQVGLMAKIAAIFGLPIKSGTFASLAAAALTFGGVTQAGKYLATNLLKFVPGAGSVAAGTIRAGVASSLTYSVGEAWIVVCEKLSGLSPQLVEAMSSEQIKTMFLEEFKRRARGVK